jgi:uncharacterized protein YbaA (DUF1428 family)
MSYVDGFIAAVPTANREKFKKHAEIAAAIFKENGALSRKARSLRSRWR